MFFFFYIPFSEWVQTPQTRVPYSGRRGRTRTVVLTDGPACRTQLRNHVGKVNRFSRSTRSLARSSITPCDFTSYFGVIIVHLDNYADENSRYTQSQSYLSFFSILYRWTIHEPESEEQPFQPSAGRRIVDVRRGRVQRETPKIVFPEYSFAGFGRSISVRDGSSQVLHHVVWWVF